MQIQRRAVWGLGLAALAAGAGVAWLRHEPTDSLPGAEDAFWNTVLSDPMGAPLDLGALRGSPLLVNFWATWCPPCVHELPLLNTFYETNAPKGWKVVGLAVDQPEAVQRFLLRLPLKFPVGMAGFNGVELSRQMGNPAGGLPFTVIMGRDGSVLDRKVGAVSEADLEGWVKAAA